MRSLAGQLPRRGTVGSGLEGCIAWRRLTLRRLVLRVRGLFLVDHSTQMSCHEFDVLMLVLAHSALHSTHSATMDIEEITVGNFVPLSCLQFSSSIPRCHWRFAKSMLFDELVSS